MSVYPYVRDNEIWKSKEDRILPVLTPTPAINFAFV